ncbi:MAG TPA: tyrosine-type recombinase/integrase [Terriglobales bacterium]|nr:tyrosine-type recombinase/integrase [Terriglobales bacterium]
MPGQIIERGKNNYVLRVYMGRDANGKRYYLNRPFHGAKKQAGQLLTKLLRDRDTGALVEPVRTTVSEYLDDWLEKSAKSRVRTRTYDFYKEALNRYIKPHLRDCALSRLTPLDIQAVYTKLLESGLSPKTVRHAHGALRLALNQAVKWRLLGNNPALYVDLPRNQKKEMSALSPDEARAFLQHAADNQWGALFALALTTGMRPGEYLGLRWKDVDLDHCAVMIRQTVTFKSGGTWEFGEPKTPKSARLIPIPPTVAKMLAAHRDKQAQEIRDREARERKKQQANSLRPPGSPYKDHGLVFAGDLGQPLELRNLVRRHFKEILKAAELPASLRLYDLRHSCATLLLAEGEHPKVVSERLGHASVTLTLDTYSHVLPTMQQEATDRLEATLFGATSIVSTLGISRSPRASRHRASRAASGSRH